MFVCVDENRIVNLKNVVFITKDKTKEDRPFIALVTNLVINNAAAEYIRTFESEKERDQAFDKLQKAIKDDQNSLVRL